VSDEITPLQSARLNLNTATVDLQVGIKSFDEGSFNDASLWIGMAIEQLQSAKAKIETQMKGGTP